MLEKFENDFKNKIEELKKDGYYFYKVDNEIAYAKKTNIPVGTGGYLKDLIKDWMLEETYNYFGEIIEKETQNIMNI